MSRSDGIAGHGVSDLVRQYYKVTMSHKLVPILHQACPIPVKHSFIPHRTTSGSVIVAVLRPVPFPMCASNDYTATQTTHTFILYIELVDD